MKLLLAEDEVQMSDAEAAFLRMRGFQVETAYDGLEALEKAGKSAFDVIVLDIMMPGMDGIEVLRALRTRGYVTPVIMLTAKSEIDDRIDGLSAGADDYLTKPFSLRELEARILAQVRRTEQFSAGTLSYQSLTLNTGEEELSCRSSVRLSGKETRLMEFLIRNAERTLTTEEICRHVWREQQEVSAEAVYLYISYLRQKLKSISSDAEILEQEAGCYVLREKKP